MSKTCFGENHSFPFLISLHHKIEEGTSRNPSALQKRVAGAIASLCSLRQEEKIIWPALRYI